MEINEGVIERGKNNWNSVFKNIEKDKITKYDKWLELFKDKIDNCMTPIIDLGCGSGTDSLYLLKKGKKVIPCDYCESAIKSIKKNLPQIERIECFDMRDGLPFEDNFTDIVIADLSLHYFSEETTFEILKEIKRVLKPNGILLFRVNSTKDSNFMPNDMIEIETNFYETSVGYKRFFNEEDINKFFSNWDKVYTNEETKERYGHKKVLWRGCYRVNK